MVRFLILILIIISLALLVPATTLAQTNQSSRYIPLTFRDTITGDIVSPLPFVGGIPVCHDPLFEAGMLGSTCHDEADDENKNETPESNPNSNLNSKYVGNDPNDDCDEECEMITKHFENEDRMREYRGGGTRRGTRTGRVRRTRTRSGY